jgi:hypothetical protein
MMKFRDRTEAEGRGQRNIECRIKNNE